MCDFKKFLFICDCNFFDMIFYSIFECEGDFFNYLCNFNSFGILLFKEFFVSCLEFLVILYRIGFFVIDIYVLCLKICDNYCKKLGVLWRRLKRMCLYLGYKGYLKVD